MFGFQLHWLRRRLPGYVVVGAGRNRRGGEHTPVLCRAGVVEVLGDRTRWFGAAPDERGSRLPGARFPRIATLVSVRTTAGQLVEIVNTHLDERSPERRRESVRQLVEWVDRSVPEIVLGDFNAEPHDPLFADLAAIGLRSALPDDAGGTAHQFTGRLDGRRLDHILVGAGVRVVEASVVTTRSGRLPSDHFPVVADLEIAG